MVLKKKDALYPRDEKGELIAQEVEIIVDGVKGDQKEYKGQKIFITPMTRGEIRKMFSNITMNKDDDESDIDGQLILKHCEDPKFTKEEIPHIKGHMATVLVNTILYHSGLDVGMPKKKAIEKKEDEFGKN